MSLAVVGAGVGRTGTLSLKSALEQLLSAPCHHMLEVFGSDELKAGWTAAAHGEAVDWNDVLRDYRATVDFPGCLFWRDLLAANPDAMVLLSVRDANDWYRSASNTILPAMRLGHDAGDAWAVTFVEMMADRFSADLDDADAMIAAYLRHNDEVRAEAPADQLVEWSPGDGWEPITEHLGVAVPDEPFPRTNSTEDFRAMFGLPPLET